MRFVRPKPLHSLLIVGMSLLPGCNDARPEGEVAQRDTLADGRVVVSYAARPVVPEDTVVADVSIGSLDSAGPYLFGDIRGIAVDQYGTLYVLDYQSSEIRTFDSTGSYRETIASSGQGPGEIAQANGLTLGPDGTLWINDHGKRALTNLSTDGKELGRYPGIVPGYGFIWGGTVDRRGVFRERWSHPVEERQRDMTATGPLEGSVRSYVMSFDPGTGTRDSVLLGLSTYHAYQAAYEGGQISMQIPFHPERLLAVDRSPAIWTALSDVYRITRFSAEGDTTMVLEVAESAQPVTDADIEDWRQSSATTFERIPSIRPAIEALMPDQKPLLQRLVTDDQGRLWVGRTVSLGEPPLFDVFSRDGEYLAAVRLFPGMSDHIAPVIRQGRVHAVVTGEFDEQYVVSGSLPEVLAGS